MNRKMFEYVVVVDWWLIGANNGVLVVNDVTLNGAPNTDGSFTVSAE